MDILVISMIYRIPIYAISLIINNPFLEKINEKIIKEIQNPENLQFNFSEMSILIIFSIIMILIIIYAIVLLTNGFRTATNLRKWQNYIWFVIALVISEILSKTLINLI
ncbi:magnesium-transporting ATPase (P-type) [Chryseobacterium sp. 16F]|uniref:Magnesium-transporting ATPase (P-type) n=1 Tax=Frigoriflavimonas asaccharolytica TaxID=2735899 RepID=A0A8J8K7Y6_9FLAO|nr:magnesium-transporting ATPase (P-type) [Frigoriflavimonas asaccharolytica]